MASDAKRQVTEDEVLFVESAFSEYQVEGRTFKRCPWCAEELKFDAVVAGYTIFCVNCKFKVTARGI